MAEYPINKGIGRPVEFKGLKAQYLFIFCGGLLALFVLFVILFMVGIDQWICIGFRRGIVFRREAWNQCVFLHGKLFNKILGREKLDFKEINYKFLKSYEEHLGQRRALSLYMGAIRHLHNEAKKRI